MVVKWKEHVGTLSEKASKSIANPAEYPNLFPGFQQKKKKTEEEEVKDEDEESDGEDEEEEEDISEKAAAVRKE